ncbi:MAG: monovalent cation/H+ antiporter subunit E [Hydrogenophaga sp.]|uniref:Na+/H+ antiporter subunit E n=1 Tax=Hydrogenophaga sp. TaxID=1904254 RepID=UPI0025C3E579|nr:Na+/H+ antiporter subunit E [Hydrogenophaga sp.]MBT9552436.1 monovalent cation/H+ antiporter subunit E [Hydrogenophaga sp.]
MKPDSPVARSIGKRHPATGWFAHPVLSVLLASSWLALSHSLEPVHLLSALLIGLVVPRLLNPFLSQASVVHWPTVLRLVGVVLWDIVVSNLVVARLVLGPMDRMRPAWIAVPLASDHPRVNALFASIITTTPGTVSAVIDEAQRVILVHALNCDDVAAMAADMKNRYEAPLLRAFHIEPGSPT